MCNSFEPVWVRGNLGCIVVLALMLTTVSFLVSVQDLVFHTIALFRAISNGEDKVPAATGKLSRTIYTWSKTPRNRNSNPDRSPMKAPRKKGYSA